MQQSQPQDQRNTVQLAQRMTKIEKFVSNLDALMKKMTEKMEQIESQNTRNTMKYNSFREDYKRLIEQQVDMRTAGHKGQYVSMDQLRSIRVTLKQIEMRMKNKVQLATMNQEISRRQRDTTELINKNKAELQRHKLQAIQHIEKLRRADEMIKIQMQKDAKESRQQSEQLHHNLSEAINVTHEAIKNSKLRINELSEKMKQIDGEIVNQRNHIAEQFKLKRQQEIRRFSEFQRKSQQIQRHRRNQVQMRLEKILIAFQALDARQTSNNERLRKEFTTVQSKMQSLQSTMTSDKQSIIDRISSFQGTFEGFRLEQTNHNEITQQHFESINNTHTNIQKQLASLKQKIKRAEVRKETRTIELDSEKLSARKKQDNQTTIDPTEAISFNNQIHGFKNNLLEFKKRTENIEHIINAIQESVERKVNISQIIQLQQSKCSKLTFKDLIMKLETLKAILQKNITSVSSQLKDLIFDETGHSQSVLSKASRARSRSKAPSRYEHRRDLSSLGQTERCIEKIESPIMKKPASAMSRSRRRYLTFFQSIDTNSDKPVFN